MKRKQFLYLVIALISIGCKAQQYPLNTYYENIPDNAYIKDLNSEYDKYIGNWKAVIGNKEIYLYITKQNNKPINTLNKPYYSDVLLIKFKVLIDNQIVENTTNFSNENVNIVSMATEDNSVIFTYTGGKCTVGWGIINTEYVDSSHLKWRYQPQSTIITNKNCSDYPAGGIKINLPYEPADIIFTKQ